MKRRLFNLAAAVSVLLALACVGFWVLTLNHLYLTGWGDPGRGKVHWTFGSVDGRVQLVYDNGLRGATPLGDWSLAGIECAKFNSGWNVWISWWLPTVLLFIAPMIWIWRAWRKRRHIDGVCPRCGYDLRATPERCPECGTPVTKKPAEVVA